MAPVVISQPSDVLCSKLHLASKPEKVSKQPDIAYHPDEVKALPVSLTLPSYGKEKARPTRLSGLAAELEEIDAALTYFRGLETPLCRVNQETLPLPTLGSVLTGLSCELYTGRGFVVAHSLPVESYSREDIILIYAGVSSYIGELRGVQDKDSGVLAHIKDYRNPSGQSYRRACLYNRQADIGDIISLFALETAASGGVSRISSSWKVYNELVKRPDLVKTLAGPWTLDTYGGDPAFRLRPLLYAEQDKIIIQYARRIFTGFLGLPRSGDIHFLAARHNLGLNFQKGDIQYINNLSIFHARDAFTDTAEKKRHLLRLWLRNEELAWKLPGGLEETWKTLYHTAAEDDQRFPLEPEIRATSKGRGAEGGNYV